jgi:hypothetical protein
VAKAGKENLIANFKDLISGNEVTKLELENLVKRDFFKQFHIRALITKNYNPLEGLDDDGAEIFDQRS